MRPGMSILRGHPAAGEGRAFPLERPQGGEEHSEGVHEVRHTLCNSASDTWLDTVVNGFSDAVLVAYSAVHGEESIVHADHRVIPDEFRTEQRFIDLLSVEPDRQGDISLPGAGLVLLRSSMIRSTRSCAERSISAR